MHLLGLFVFAQIIQDGIVFGGSGNQKTTKCFIDKIGNKYLVVEFGENFILDSAGRPITIEKSIRTTNNKLNNSLAIVKLDINEIYLYHIKIDCKGNNGSRLDIEFDSDNHAYVRYNFAQRDTIDLIGKQGELYKSIFATFNMISSNGSNMASLVLKLTSSGEFAWTNTIFHENSYNIFNNTWLTYNISINNSNEISFFYVVTKNNLGPLSDTIALINNLGQKSSHVVSSLYCLFKFDKFGNFISVKEPFKNSLNPTKINSFGSISHDEHISDGQNAYIITTFSLTDVDTFKATGISIPLNSGFYYFLIKLNAFDSIILAKPIAKNITNFIFMAKINLALNKYKTELSVDCVHNPSLYYFLLNQNFANNGIGRYLGRFSSDGNLISETLLASTVISFSGYNQFSNDLTVLGVNSGNDTKLNPFLPVNSLNNPIAFIAYLDSSNNVISAQPIISNNQQMSKNINFNFEMGSPLTDNNGRTFIPGWFSDSISLPCKKLIGDLDRDTADFGIIILYNDGFLLKTQAYNFKDTSACYQIVSPSGKYTWLSSGLYSDTLTNILGCDSIIRFRINITNNQINIDTSVKYTYTSPSKKYTWDSTGLYVDSLVNRFGCDSILFINLRVLNNKNKLDTFNCIPISYWSKNQIIRQ
ncbi:MAG: hypothetical protein Q8R57_15220, partial [Bacteroidota bacterium]|nr:hypothetical protein [Bacteroidota bacterium]